MKKALRSNIFETNSSSVHSLVWADRKNKNFFIPSYIKEKSEFIVRTGDFGTSPYTLWNIEDKLSYIITLALELDNSDSYREEYDDNYEYAMSLPDVQKICETFYKYTGVELRIAEESITDGLEWRWYEGYIDHQSREDFHCLQDFLSYLI